MGRTHTQYTVRSSLNCAQFMGLSQFVCVDGILYNDTGWLQLISTTVHSRLQCMPTSVPCPDTRGRAVVACRATVVACGATVVACRATVVACGATVAAVIPTSTQSQVAWAGQPPVLWPVASWREKSSYDHPYNLALSIARQGHMAFTRHLPSFLVVTTKSSWQLHLRWHMRHDANLAAFSTRVVHSALWRFVTATHQLVTRFVPSQIQPWFVSGRVSIVFVKDDCSRPARLLIPGRLHIVFL